MKRTVLWWLAALTWIVCFWGLVAWIWPHRSRSSCSRTRSTGMVWWCSTWGKICYTTGWRVGPTCSWGFCYQTRGLPNLVIQTALNRIKCFLFAVKLFHLPKKLGMSIVIPMTQQMPQYIKVFFLVNAFAYKWLWQMKMYLGRTNLK